MVMLAVGQTPVPAHPPAPPAAPASAGPSGNKPDSKTAPEASVDPLPPGPGKSLVSDTCTGCHTLDRIVGRHMSREGWLGTVDDMISRGADISTGDETKIVDYLTANFGKTAAGGGGGAKR